MELGASHLLERMNYNFVCLPHSKRQRFERRCARCRHLGWNITTHLHQVMKLMAQSVY